MFARFFSRLSHLRHDVLPWNSVEIEIKRRTKLGEKSFFSIILLCSRLERGSFILQSSTSFTSITSVSEGLKYSQISQFLNLAELRVSRRIYLRLSFAEEG